MTRIELSFDWDQWNIQKNEIKHGVSQLEAESVFYDPGFMLFDDVRHRSASESRYIGYGESKLKRVLMVAFTFRKKKVRIISARPASRKERQVYHESQT
jgi:uncharacterized DUF497 family protein